jgi:malonyl-CoA/methylmalonyl-CoA synthetase
LRRASRRRRARRRRRRRSDQPEGGRAVYTSGTDDDLGERIVAWVVRVEAASPQELAGHVAALLAPHKRPREVRFVAALPRNEMGKVRKREVTR